MKSWSGFQTVAKRKEVNAEKNIHACIRAQTSEYISGDALKNEVRGKFLVN